MHSYFRQAMKLIRNFKNPPKCLRYKYENLRAAQMLTAPNVSPGDFLYKEDQSFITELVEVKNEPMLLHLFGNPNTCVVSCKHLVCKNVKYSIDNVLLISRQPLVFAVLKKIFLHGDIKIFKVSILRNPEYLPLKNVFMIPDTTPTESKFVFQENLAFFRPLPYVQTGYSLSIVPKYSNINLDFHV